MSSEANHTYNVSIIKGSALLPETRTLLGHWQPGEKPSDFMARVQQQDLLGRATDSRTKDIVRKVFTRRFLKPSDAPARVLKLIAEAKLPPRTFTEMAFVYTCRENALLNDFTSQVYWEAVRRGRSTLGSDDIRELLSEALDGGRLERQWSEESTQRVASGVLNFLHDIGYLGKYRRGQREILSYRMSEEGAGCLAWQLHESGVTDSALPDHPDWMLFGMGRNDVIEKLEDLGEHRGLIVQAAGSVVSITWKAKSFEEFLNVLA